jgi:deazaflavin-dependent oxidoreductase (nitroreductase family)
MNPVVKTLLRLGIPFGPATLLTVRGRKTGGTHTTPVVLFEHMGYYYVFGEFGDVDWTRNLRTSGEATIGRGWRRKKVAAVELTVDRAAMVLRDVLPPFLRYQSFSSRLRTDFELDVDSTEDDYFRAAKRHPGFELLDK